MSNDGKEDAAANGEGSRETARWSVARLGVIIAVPIVIIAVIVTSWVGYRRKKRRAAFDEVPLGTPESEVVRELGTPWKVAKCGETFGGGSAPGCTEEVIYQAPFAPRTPRYWAFQFDWEGKLMSKWEDLPSPR